MSEVTSLFYSILARRWKWRFHPVHKHISGECQTVLAEIAIHIHRAVVVRAVGVVTDGIPDQSFSVLSPDSSMSKLTNLSDAYSHLTVGRWPTDLYWSNLSLRPRATLACVSAVKRKRFVQITAYLAPWLSRICLVCSWSLGRFAQYSRILPICNTRASISTWIKLLENQNVRL